MHAVLILFNNFLHDLTSAVWFVAALTMWILDREAIARGNRYVKALYEGVFPTLFKVSAISLALNLILGGVRAWAYYEYEFLPAAGRGQVTALIGKHLLLFSVVIIGLLIQSKLIRRYREIRGGHRNID